MTTGASPRTISSATTITVTGATTPSDAQANPTTAIDTSAKASFWDGSQWRRALTDAAGALKIAPVAVTGAVLFPTAAALADAFANPTATAIGALGSVFNGTTWDRIRGSLGGITSGVLATWTGVPHSLNILRYLSTRPTLATGEGTHHQSNTRGDLAVEEQRQENAFANSNSVCVVAQKKVRNTDYSTKKLVQDYATTITLNCSTTQNVVTAVFVTNRNAAVRYFQLHNTATTPAGGATAALSIAVPPGTAFMLTGEDFFGPQGYCPGTSGVAYAWSTVAATYTAGTAADHDTVVMGGG